jgi:hypothetical protein
MGSTNGAKAVRCVDDEDEEVEAKSLVSRRHRCDCAHFNTDDKTKIMEFFFEKMKDQRRVQIEYQWKELIDKSLQKRKITIDTSFSLSC